MMKQKEAVFLVVTQFIGKDFKEGMDCGKWFKDRPTVRTEVIAKLCGMFEAGEITLERKQENIKTYVHGLLANHLRKDTRLNGGEKYVPANPGSRAGSGDPEIREIRKLLKQVKGSANEAKVQAILDAKIAAVKKTKQPSIDSDLLPQELKHLA